MSQTEEEKAFFTGVNVIGNRSKQQEKTKIQKTTISKRAVSALPKKQKKPLFSHSAYAFSHVSTVNGRILSPILFAYSSANFKKNIRCSLALSSSLIITFVHTPASLY